MSTEQCLEGPCAICTRLTPNADLTTVSSSSIDLTLLIRDDIKVTRQTRTSDVDSLLPIAGPILYAPACATVKNTSLLLAQYVQSFLTYPSSLAFPTQILHYLPTD